MQIEDSCSILAELTSSLNFYAQASMHNSHLHRIKGMAVFRSKKEKKFLSGKIIIQTS